jgi:hypothetical protein
MRKIILITVSLLFLVFPAISFAEISQIVFTTDSQNIQPNILSLPITIQVQDSKGVSSPTPETMDVQFVSTSATGKFLNSSGNPATTYISKNTANKSFYYKDSTEGTFTITINIRGRDSGIELDASQNIEVSSGASQISNNSDEGSSGGSSESSSSRESNTNVSTPNSKFEISAGTDRATSPGSPIWFQAVIKKNTANSDPVLNWSFGDGNVGSGYLVNHEYKYSGDYVVVLTARAGDIFSVSRLKVKVAEPNIFVTDNGNYFEISNNGNAEINLFNWKIENAGKGFIFQPNTIILPHSSIKLEKNLLMMKGLDNSQELRLKNSFGQKVFAIAHIENLNQEASVIQTEFQTSNQNPKIIKKEAVSEIIPEVTTSTDNIVYEAPRQVGLISRLTNFLKRVFFK